jgi:hypothetical protein
MIGVEDNLEGGEDSERGESRKLRKNKKSRLGSSEEVRLLKNVMMIAAFQRYMTFMVGDMKVGDIVRVSSAGYRNGENWRNGIAV